MTTTAVVALKSLGSAKTRFSLPGLPAPVRARLVLCMALDVVSALEGAGAEVIVVSDEPSLAGHLRRSGLDARVVAEPAVPGLNPALAHGASLATGDRVLACVADLPGLRSEHLPPLLTAGPGRWFVPDLSGTGTTMLLAAGVPLAPLFERASAARHRASGAREVLLPDAARHDVDTPDDLAGLPAPGPHTAALLETGLLETGLLETGLLETALSETGLAVVSDPGGAHGRRSPGP